jgi:hypothetical protein
MRVNGRGELFNKATGDALGPVDYDLDYQPPTTERLGHFTRMHVNIGWKVASKAIHDNILLTLETTAGFVDLFVSQLSMTSDGGETVGVTMTGGFHETLNG